MNTVEGNTHRQEVKPRANVQFTKIRQSNSKEKKKKNSRRDGYKIYDKTGPVHAAGHWNRNIAKQPHILLHRPSLTCMSSE